MGTTLRLTAKLTHNPMQLICRGQSSNVEISAFLSTGLLCLGTLPLIGGHKHSAAPDAWRNKHADAVLIFHHNTLKLNLADPE